MLDTSAPTDSRPALVTDASKVVRLPILIETLAAGALVVLVRSECVGVFMR
ncbi:hypothetical protein C8J42_104132 [Sphingomonas sp. PP-CE-1A-559]|nr:hypothetical protein C8J42_104132 [Sphingomonas sp. PP-CE-1A-559]